MFLCFINLPYFGKRKQVHFLCFGENEKNVIYFSLTFRNQLFLRSGIIFFQQGVPFSLKNENPFLLP